MLSAWGTTEEKKAVTEVNPRKLMQGIMQSCAEERESDYWEQYQRRKKIASLDAENIDVIMHASGTRNFNENSAATEVISSAEYPDISVKDRNIVQDNAAT
ncbi:hypothetical protein QAD02_013093 [Eretmocerus hayati]|uniref:Uncharacterized protein n=1 Tax=Eretmocerus hayati TaxID=131215 RepID=A0ACC2P3C4_9HYME|nr:hypothetical protein QAD02_013093 [Eretmocerus hayati]